MADFTLLEALQAFHQELVAVREGRVDPAEVLNNELLVQAFENELERLWSRPPKNEESRKTILSGTSSAANGLAKACRHANTPVGKMTVNDESYSLNQYFQQSAIAFADEVDLDEIEAAQYLLESQEDPAIMGRSLLECAIIRFHQQRKFALDSVRLLLELDGVGEDPEDDEDEDVMPLEAVQVYVAERIYMSTVGSKRQPLLPLILPAMSNMKAWLQKLGDKVTAAQTLGQAGPGGLSEEAETIEYTRVSLIQEHELLGVILCRLVTKRQATVKDFEDFLAHLRKLDRYDHLLGWFSPYSSLASSCANQSLQFT
jgi:nuclear pore complex protein Nup205